jgi:hypothetical protein
VNIDLPTLLAKGAFSILLDAQSISPQDTISVRVPELVQSCQEVGTDEQMSIIALDI